MHDEKEIEKAKGERSGSESRNEKRGKITKKERDNSTCSRTGLSLIFDLPKGDPRDEREEGTICAGGRNSGGNEQPRREEEEEEEEKEDRGSRTMRGSHLC